MGTAAFIIATGIFLICFALWISWREKKEGLTR
jgi:cbb3-type cytochrome oxidase subunit 3